MSSRILEAKACPRGLHHCVQANLESLEMRRLRPDLLWAYAYKIVSGLVTQAARLHATCLCLLILYNLLVLEATPINFICATVVLHVNKYFFSQRLMQPRKAGTIYVQRASIFVAYRHFKVVLYPLIHQRLYL